jgi:hypothetical protein
MKTIVFFLATLVPAIVSAQETPTVGYAPVWPFTVDLMV